MQMHLHNRPFTSRSSCLNNLGSDVTIFLFHEVPFANIFALLMSYLLNQILINLCANTELPLFKAHSPCMKCIQLKCIWVDSSKASYSYKYSFTPWHCKLSMEAVKIK